MSTIRQIARKKKWGDLQRAKVYLWERINVAPYDKNVVSFMLIPQIVNFVWEQEGLRFPPRVERLPKQVRRFCGDATRLCVRFGEETYTWIILHELAHSCTSTVEQMSNGHGSLFMGIYIQMLSRYLKLSYNELVESAERQGLHVELSARPVFLDK